MGKQRDVEVAIAGFTYAELITINDQRQFWHWRQQSRRQASCQRQPHPPGERGGNTLDLEMSTSHLYVCSSGGGRNIAMNSVASDGVVGIGTVSEDRAACIWLAYIDVLLTEAVHRNQRDLLLLTP